LNLPTRRPFDTEDQLDDRLRRAERAFGLAYELGSRLVLARVGAVPPEADADRRAVLSHALGELGRRADHLGARLAVETGTEPGEVLRGLLDTLDSPGLAASLDPAALLLGGFDPALTARALGPWAAHAYATDPATAGQVSRAVLPRGFGSPALDWEEYLGSLEEINYRGYLTVWPDPASEPGAQLAAIVERLKKF